MRRLAQEAQTEELKNSCLQAANDFDLLAAQAGDHAKDHE